MRLIKVLGHLAEMALDVVRVLGGNWSALISLVLSGAELFELLRERTAAAAV